MSIRRLIDIIVSFFLIITLSPLLLIIGLIIKITSPGPIIFKQKRCGRRGKIFVIWKFRTMFNEKSEDIVICKNDKRITPIGKFLRSTHLDEIPQLWNILKGDMCFVGPRPKKPREVELLNRLNINYKKIFLVKPGLTGIIQINGREWLLLNLKEALEQEIRYAKNKNFWQDLKIILLTIPVIIKKRGF